MTRSKRFHFIVVRAMADPTPPAPIISTRIPTSPPCFVTNCGSPYEACFGPLVIQPHRRDQHRHVTRSVVNESATRSRSLVGEVFFRGQTLLEALGTVPISALREPPTRDSANSARTGLKPNPSPGP